MMDRPKDTMKRLVKTMNGKDISILTERRIIESMAFPMIPIMAVLIESMAFPMIPIMAVRK